MSKHNETGVKGEQIAEKYLLDKGHRLLHRNWCFGKKEVDLITQKDDMLVFTEVKTRSRMDYGFPEEAVNYKKQAYLKTAAEAFLETFPGYIKIQFDIISVHIDKGAIKEIRHFEDAFY
jgi:putative endonuclease